MMQKRWRASNALGRGKQEVPVETCLINLKVLLFSLIIIIIIIIIIILCICFVTFMPPLAGIVHTGAPRRVNQLVNNKQVFLLIKKT